MKVYGKDIVLSVNGRNIAASTGCAINVEQDFIDVASPKEGRARRVIPSKYAWSASMECLCNTMVDADTFMQYIIEGTELRISLTDADSLIRRTGTAYVQSVNATGNIGNLAKVSIALQGSGTLSEAWTAKSKTTVANDKYLTHDANGWAASEDDTIDCVAFDVTGKLHVRLRFGDNTSYAEVVPVSLADLRTMIANGTSQTYATARKDIVHVENGFADIVLTDGPWCITMNGNDVVSVSVPS